MSHAGTETSLTTFGPLHHDRGNNDGDNDVVELNDLGADRHAPSPPPTTKNPLFPGSDLGDVELSYLGGDRQHASPSSSPTSPSSSQAKDDVAYALPLDQKAKQECIKVGWAGTGIVYYIREKTYDSRFNTQVEVSISLGDKLTDVVEPLLHKPGNYSIGVAGSIRGNYQVIAIFNTEFKPDDVPGQRSIFKACLKYFINPSKPIHVWKKMIIQPKETVDGCGLSFPTTKTGFLDGHEVSFLYGHDKPVKAIAFSHSADLPLLASVGCADAREDGKDKAKSKKNNGKVTGRVGWSFDALKKLLWDAYRNATWNAIFPMFAPKKVDCIGEIIIWDEHFHQPATTIHVKIAKEVHEGLHLDEIKDEGLFSICWSPSCPGNPESAVACGGRRCVYVYDSRTGKQLCKPSEMSWNSVEDEDIGQGDTAEVIAWSPAWPSQASERHCYIVVGVFKAKKGKEGSFMHIWRCKSDSKRVQAEKLDPSEFECNCSASHGIEKITDLSWRIDVNGDLQLLSISKSRANVWSKSRDDGSMWDRKSDCDERPSYPLPFPPEASSPLIK